MTSSKKLAAVKPLVYDSYLAVIKNSIGAKIWQNGYVEIDGQKTDIYRKGDLSCAFFVSSVLKLFGLISRVHATVSSTIKDLEKSGWKKVRKPLPGNILIWRETKGNDGLNHLHIGFYIGNNQAISNSSRTRTPQKHHWTYGNKRRITAIYHRDI